MPRRSPVATAAALLLLAGVAGAAETRCGWYQMPTPGNLLLTDKDASWSITSQGQALGPDAIGVEKAPTSTRRSSWKRTCRVRVTGTAASAWSLASMPSRTGLSGSIPERPNHLRLAGMTRRCRPQVDRILGGGDWAPRQVLQKAKIVVAAMNSR